MQIDAEHEAWLATEHAKFARKLIRTLKHVEAAGGGSQEQEVPAASVGGKRGNKNKRKPGHGMSEWERTLGDTLRARFGDECSLDDLKAQPEALLGCLHCEAAR